MPVGGGFGGIAVAGGRVYLLDRQKEPREVERVLCLDAMTGKTVWSHEYPVAYGKLDYGNGPRTTPTIHAGKVYAYGAVGHLHCLDAATGKVVWAIDTVKDLKGRFPTWGHASSPLVDQGRVVVQAGAPDGCLMAFDAATGKEVWRALADRPGYASAVIAENRETRQLLYWTAENVAGLNPATGETVWRVPFTFDYDVAISDPIHHQGIVLAGNYWTGSKAVRVPAAGEKPTLAWEGKALSLLMSTPLARDGHVYAIDRFRGLKCVELETGKVKWEGQFVVRRGDSNPHAALVWAGDRALILNEDGDLFVARLSPEKFESVSKSKAFRPKGRLWAHPAFADGCMFVRDDDTVACVPLTAR
jgi:outer membrane protein assembly factor BamB